MQTELVNQIEVKLRKIYQAAYQPAYLEKMLACAENYSNNTRGSIDTISEKKCLSYCLWRQHFRKKQTSVTNIE